MKNKIIQSNQKSNSIPTLQFCLILGLTFLALDLLLYGLGSLLLGFLLKTVLSSFNQDILNLILIVSKLLFHAILIYHIFKSVMNIIFGFVKVDKKEKAKLKSYFYLTWGIIGLIMSLTAITSPLLAILTFLLFTIYLPIVKKALEK